MISTASTEWTILVTEIVSDVHILNKDRHFMHTCIRAGQSLTKLNPITLKQRSIELQETTGSEKRKERNE